MQDDRKLRPKKIQISDIYWKAPFDKNMQFNTKSIDHQKTETLPETGLYQKLYITDLPPPPTFDKKSCWALGSHKLTYMKRKCI